MRYIQYDPNTGEILCFYNMPQDSASYMAEQLGFCLMETENADVNCYVDITKTPHEIALKHAQKTTQSATQIYADGEDTLKLDNLPIPCKVSIGSQTYTVNDGCLEWCTLLHGTYPIQVSAFPYLVWRGEVKAT